MSEEEKNVKRGMFVIAAHDKAVSIQLMDIDGTVKYAIAITPEYAADMSAVLMKCAMKAGFILRLNGRN